MEDDGFCIEISDLCVHFRGARGKRIEAVKDLHLNVRPGEVVGFIGPNGAGKTTTIKVLMGFLAPQSGRVRVLGEAPGALNAKRRIGFLPEVALYYPFLSAREALLTYAVLADIPRNRRKAVVDALLEKVGLSGRENEALRTYSKGMLQRVGIAQAVMGEPDLLILDEITSGLDPVARHDVRAILLDFKQRGKTVFFSSHELTEVALLCDRIVLLDEGRLKETRALPDILASLKVFVVVAENAGNFEPPLPETRLAAVAGKRRTYVANSPAARDELLRTLTAAGATVVDTREEQGSLEEYFVSALGHKVT